MEANNNNKAQIINTFRDRGYYFPIDLLSDNEDFYYKKYITSIEKIKKSSLKYEHKFKSHLIFSGVLALVIAICCRLKAPK